jgi:CPA2 family monovalent cation:H+ antiporter-2
MGEVLAAAALPEKEKEQVDLAEAPRRALIVMLQFATVSLTSLPILVVTQPFVPGVLGAGVLVAILVGFGILFWRGAANLQGHVRAGAQVIVESLARYARGPEYNDMDVLAHLREALPGLGEPVAVRLQQGSAAVGKTLAELDLRGLTGATALALWRPKGGAMVPSAREVLLADDVLALAGTGEAVTAARELLAVPRSPGLAGF